RWRCPDERRDPTEDEDPVAQHRLAHAGGAAAGEHHDAQPCDPLSQGATRTEERVREEEERRTEQRGGEWVAAGDQHERSERDEQIDGARGRPAPEIRRWIRRALAGRINLVHRPPAQPGRTIAAPVAASILQPSGRFGGGVREDDVRSRALDAGEDLEADALLVDPSG